MQNNFIVIEGLDGSGKSTQVKQLKQYLEQSEIPYKYIHFPRMENSVFGEMVAKFLRGEFGNLNDVNPYLVAMLYAGDRKDAAHEIRQWINDGNLVLLDRYVYSNVAYQCAKIKSEEERKKLREWILNFEFVYYKIPKPELSVFLDVPFDFTAGNLTNQREGDDRNYLDGKSDIHESDLSFQESVRQMYLWQTSLEPDFMCLKCYDEDMKMFTSDVVFNKLLTILNLK